MFTGLIEDLGFIKKKENTRLIITTSLDNIKIGDSVSVNGVCLTARVISGQDITLDVMPETFRKTILNDLRIRDKVNLERALVFGDRIGGHMVSGHVEDIGIIRSIMIEKNARVLEIKATDYILDNIHDKGSVALDGISLTVVKKHKNYFLVSIIPETWDKTNLSSKRAGSKLNIETDYLTRNKNKENKNNITYNLLQNEGYI